MTFGPECPRCGHAVGFWAAQFGRGRTFPCRGCGQRLVAPKAAAVAAVGLFVLFWLQRDRISSHSHGWLIFILVILLLAVLEYALLKVRVAKNGSL